MTTPRAKAKQGGARCGHHLFPLCRPRCDGAAGRGHGAMRHDPAAPRRWQRRPRGRERLPGTCREGLMSCGRRTCTTLFGTLRYLTVPFYKLILKLAGCSGAFHQSNQKCRTCDISSSLRRAQARAFRASLGGLAAESNRNSGTCRSFSSLRRGHARRFRASWSTVRSSPVRFSKLRAVRSFCGMMSLMTSERAVLAALARTASPAHRD